MSHKELAALVKLSAKTLGPLAVGAHQGNAYLGGPGHPSSVEAVQEGADERRQALGHGALLPATLCLQQGRGFGVPALVFRKAVVTLCTPSVSHLCASAQQCCNQPGALQEFSGNPRQSSLLAVSGIRTFLIQGSVMTHVPARPARIVVAELSNALLTEGPVMLWFQQAGPLSTREATPLVAART